MQPPHSAADSIHEARLMEAPSLLTAELQLSDLAHLADDPELVSDEFAGDDGTFACDLSGGGNDATGAGYWELNQGSNQHTIKIQLEQRIRFDIKTLAPRLHGLLHNVSDISTPRDAWTK
ncbi:hypothetical protein BC834DRAFT_845037 [Gloeopeniophorella convolvens]|nr:hypothetical protein BC834DRAFT_845037 [Gloeopeniophorella convolvens]